MAAKEIKKGAICTLTRNNNIIFRFVGVSEHGFPISDLSIYRSPVFCYRPIVTKGTPFIVAYTDAFQEATDSEKETFNRFKDEKDARWVDIV